MNWKRLALKTQAVGVIPAAMSLPPTGKDCASLARSAAIRKMLTAMAIMHPGLADPARGFLEPERAGPELGKQE